MPTRLIALGLLLALTNPAHAEHRPAPPSVEFAQRVLNANRRARIIPAVVIVHDATAYLAALQGWDGDMRFPVLWDDGTPEAAADIARFVHAFKPDRILRFEPAAAPAFPAAPAERIRRLEQVLFSSVLASETVASLQEMIDRLRARDRLGPGIVVTDVSGEQWPAAIALAVGRQQPIAFTSSPGRLSIGLSLEQATELEQFIRTFIEGLGLEWAGMGDDVDAVTLALECPARVRVGQTPPDFLATTDWIGRRDDAQRTRWAFVGQIAGNEPRSAYVAMCSLFLTPSSAWIFDGYESAEGWDAFDGTAAGQALAARGLSTTVFDDPRQGLDQWRAACVRPVDAGLVFVNTMGNADFFRLRPGDAAPGDIPIFLVPPAVHFVHSFSAMRPGNIDTVGGRILAHGAYVYLGSVQEPTLGAFVPTPRVARRVLAGLPFSVAMRGDAGPPWKLAFFGDPMAAGVPELTRSDALITLEPLLDLESEARSAVSSGRFADAVRLFSMLDRDDDAARLATALLREKPEAFDAGIAREALLPLFRTGKVDEVAECFRRLDTKDQTRTLFLDALWLSARLRMYADTSVTALLSQHLRPDQRVADAIELSRALAHQHGSAAAVGLLQVVRNETTDKRDLRKLDQQIRSLMSGSP
ncbi:MAG: hypothetical protein Kow0022_12340 [Phycisphaerales bacterium]